MNWVKRLFGRDRPDFLIRSTETIYQEVHGCQIKKVLEREKLLVRFIPPIPKSAYDMPEDLSEAILVRRHAGTRLVPDVSEWPMRVNVVLPKSDQKGGKWEIVDIAVIFRTLDEVTSSKSDDRLSVH